MGITIERTTEKPKDVVKDLQQQLLEKDKQIADLKEQVELVQMAVDDIILGGMI